MKQIKVQEEVTGKTIKEIKDSGNLCFLVFTDETFAVLKGTNWAEFDDDKDVTVTFSETVIQTDVDKCITYPELSLLMDAGFITHSEFMLEIAKRKKKNEEEQIQSEIKLLAHLKAKYPEAA